MKNLFQKIALILSIFCITGIVYSIISVTLWKLDSKKTVKLSHLVNSLTENKEENIFDELKKINPDVKGWIKVDGTNIDYPFVQSQDNEFYLTHSFDKSANKAGWIFLDYRNGINSLDKNIIIYGHDRKDKTMFGSLENVFKKDWQEKKDDNAIKIVAEQGESTWQVFSLYHIKNTDDYLQTSFPSDKEFQKFLDMIKDRSLFQHDIDLDSNDQILTLSTCYSKSEKTVVHAKLIRR